MKPEGLFEGEQKRRSRLEIMLQALNIINNGIDKPTRIMYASNMSWNSIQRVLVSMIAQGLIEKKELVHATRKKRRYYITEKGKEVLAFFKNAPVI